MRDKRVRSHWIIWIPLHTGHDLHTGYEGGRGRVSEAMGGVSATDGSGGDVSFFALPVVESRAVAWL